MVRVAPKPRPPVTPPAKDPLGSTAASVLKDGKVTDAEWQKKLQPQLQKAAVESPEVRAFLDVFADGKITFEKNAALGAGDLLRAHGYEVPGRDSGITFDVRVVVDGNAAAPDQAFETLSTLTRTSNSKIAIGVVDGGFSAHPALMDNLSPNGKTIKAAYGAALGKEFGKRSADAKREGAIHGTHVAGIAARGTPRIQAALMAVPLETAAEVTGAATHTAVRPPPEKQPLVLALDHAAKNGAQVINVSIEAYVTPEEVAAFKKVMDKHPNTLFVFGAGNDQYQLGSATEGDKSLAEQLRCPNMVVVGASYPDGGRWGKSNYGKDFVQLAARGHYISSADGDGDGFRIESGTSMAAPNITNLAAKCRMLHPALSPAQLVTLMSITSDENHSWKDAVASGGTVNNDRAMTAAATLALLASGKQLEAALDTLGVSATERPRIKTAVDALSR